MNCKSCGKPLKEGDTHCWNCGVVVGPAVAPEREKASDVVSCLVIGLFVFFGIPALLFGSYLLAVGLGATGGSKSMDPRHQFDAILVSCIPLGVFAILLILLLKVRTMNRK